MMDERIEAVLETYHGMIEAERAARGDRQGLTGGRHLDQNPAERDRLLRAVGPETGRLINLIARSFPAPNLLELGTSRRLFRRR